MCEKTFVFFIAQLQSMFNLRRMNSTLSEDCERYIGEVSELSMERDKLNEKVTQYEEKMKVSLYS